MFERISGGPASTKAGRSTKTKKPADPAVVRAAVGAQARLVVGAAGDAYEREADTIARQVVAALTAGRTEQPIGGEASTAPRRVAPTRIRRRAPIGAEGGELDADTERAITSARSQGRPLGESVRRDMEGAIGADFGRVRIHEGPSASELNHTMNASAFTLGSDIFMRDRLDASSRTGQETLAHELVHVVQQGGAPRPQRVMRELLADTEAETDELEDETEGGEEGPVIVGSIPDMNPAVLPEELKGVGEEKEDATVRVRRGSRGTRRSRSSSGTHVMSVSPVIGLNVSTPETDVDETGQARDSLSASKINVNWTNPSGKPVTPFGSESFGRAYKNVTFTAKGEKIKVAFDLDITCSWGTNGGTKKDVASAASSEVKEDTWQQVVTDLTPVKKEKSWVAPRSQYWSQGICERHEKYHSTDDKSWVQSKGKGIVKKYLKEHPITLSDAERKDNAVIKTKIEKVLTEALAALGTANSAFYKGGSSSYYSYAGEERAFGDGKDPYLKLVAGVKAKGKKFESDKKKAEAATAKAAKKTPDTAPTTDENATT